MRYNVLVRLCVPPRRVLRRPRGAHQVRGLLRQIPDPVVAVPVLVQVHRQQLQRARRQHRQQHDEESVARLTTADSIRNGRYLKHNMLYFVTHAYTCLYIILSNRNTPAA